MNLNTLKGTKKLMLSIKNLHASIGGKEIKGINLEVKAGEIHAIMGPTVPEKYACVNHRRK
jgi:Fe-S cluster assembly ATPase SufC